MSAKPTYEELEQRVLELEASTQEDFSQVFINILENATDFLYFKDKAHRFTAASQAFANLTGHRHWRDLIGKHDLEIFPEQNAKIYYDAELPIMNEGKPDCTQKIESMTV